MIADAVPVPFAKRSALLAISVGGLTAGVLDLTQACILFGRDIPLVIAAGLLGPRALHGSSATYIRASCCTSSSPSPLRRFITWQAAG